MEQKRKELTAGRAEATTVMNVYCFLPSVGVL